MTKSSSSADIAGAWASRWSSAWGRGSTGAWDIGLGALVVLDLGSGSGLGSTFSVFACGVLSLGWVVVFLWYADGSGDIEGSLGNFTVLLLVGSSHGGFGNLSLVGDGVLVWDDDVLGTDLGVGSSGLGGELGVSTGSLLTTEGSGLSTEVVSTAWGSVSATAWGIAWGASTSGESWGSWGAFEGDGGSTSDKGSNDEVHLN